MSKSKTKPVLSRADAMQSSPRDYNSRVDTVPLLVLDRLGIETLTPDHRSHFLSLLQGKGMALSFDDMVGGRSFNSEQIDAMGLLWTGTKTERDYAVEFLTRYYRAQLGIERPADPKEELLGYFMGNEPYSPIYWEWLWMVDAWVWIWCQTYPYARHLSASHQVLSHPLSELQNLAARSLRCHVALASLLAVPGPVSSMRARNGRLIQNTPFVLPVGARGKGRTLSSVSALYAEATSMLPADLRQKRLEVPIVIFREMVRLWREAYDQPIAWRAFGPHKHVIEQLAGLKFKGEMTIARWDEGRGGVIAAWMPRINGNTNPNLGCVVDLWTGVRKVPEVQLLYPYPEGKTHPGGEVWLEDVSSDPHYPNSPECLFETPEARYLHAKYGSKTVTKDLPTSPASSVVVLNASGVQCYT